MPQHPLIERYVRDLRRDLSAEVVDELAGGLSDTFDDFTARGLDPETAAAATLADFGDVREIVEGFARIAPGRRTARALLATGPLIGCCWAVALLTSHAWRWPVPAVGRVAFGVVLLTTIILLAAAARISGIRTCRALALTGTGGLLVLDVTAIIAVSALTPTLTGPPLLAVVASLTRIGLTTPSIHRILSDR